MARNPGFGRRFTKGIDLYNATIVFFGKEKGDLRQGHKALAQWTYDDWKELTAGTLTKQQTAGAFARGLAPSLSTPTGLRRTLSVQQIRKRNLAGQLIRGQVPLLPINMQSHRLNDSIHVADLSRAGSQVFDVGPDASAGKSKWVLVPTGTGRMVARGIWAEIERRWKARNKAWFDAFAKQ